ncbi:hypothetical protein JX265_011579 [Neoarthrinium moseri]|uniref:Uncharacterized protein n=1 Tax=Neoarthrinium moseri TaxID=1658444 RepID=A0A9P9WCB2_9PEZI|nr:uncharacterized protein JN550_011671 [Neoarthrinium moseri]KAI1848567.1 hypothetical protein JX266_005426 [Neoarthrinium moseri]KAI1856620.1 hypothetical protein JX265_011579 [Neoarthrinium moseri]KAI1859987.1 hypothetical protein JN550_011671 [Neoarthrinium moseri]
MLSSWTVLSIASLGIANHQLPRQGLLSGSGSASAPEFPTAPASPPFTVVTASAPATASGPIPLPTTGSGPKCGKGYTYCGYMLQSGGHNFAPDVINKTYCEGLEGNCLSGVPRTKPDQAVFLCMDDSPASIQLFCACGGKCLNEQQSNNIAHCDTPCTNGQKCFE